MTKLLIVGLGGFFGAIARYGLSGLAQRRFEAFPAGTLAVNALGCLLIGVVMTLVEERQALSPETRLFLSLGFLGSMTTFSTFGYETVELLRAQETRLALASVALNLLVGFGAVLVGRALTRAIW